MSKRVVLGEDGGAGTLRGSNPTGKEAIATFVEAEDVEPYPPPGQSRAIRVILDELQTIRGSKFNTAERLSVGDEMLRRAERLHDSYRLTYQPILNRRDKLHEAVIAVLDAAAATRVAHSKFTALGGDPALYLAIFGEGEGELSLDDYDAFATELEAISTRMAGALKHTEQSGFLGREAARQSGARIPLASDYKGAGSAAKGRNEGRPRDAWKADAVDHMIVIFRHAGCGNAITAKGRFADLTVAFATNVAGTNHIGVDAIATRVRQFPNPDPCD